MSEPTIVYFPVRGRAELIRLTLAAAGKTWKEEVVTGENLPQWKEKGVLAFGQVPLYQEGDLNLVQSVAIARYIARNNGLYGDALEGAKIDIVLDGIGDFFAKLIPLLYPVQKDDELKKFFEETAPVWLGHFEKFVEKNGTEGHVIGHRLTLADLAIVNLLENLHGKYDPSKYPHLKTVFDHITNKDPLKKYLESPTRYPARG